MSLSSLETTQFQHFICSIGFLGTQANFHKVGAIPSQVMTPMLCGPILKQKGELQEKLIISKLTLEKQETKKTKQVVRTLNKTYWIKEFPFYNTVN